MKHNDIHIATATVHFSDLYYSQHRCCYMFDLKFEKTSTLLFDNLVFIPAGEDKDIAEDFLNTVTQYFATAGIREGNDVAVLFSANQVLAISSRGNDLWLDVHEGIFPNVSPRYFRNLGITVASLTVH